MSVFDEYGRKHEFLVCIDSDGCAMDTMDCKHFYCFGPCMVKEWELEPWKDEILDYWNHINLYSMSRGINRFLGLAMVLSHVHDTYKEISQIKEFSSWAQKTAQLSNESVKAAWEETGCGIFKKALSWSQAVNEAIAKLPDELKKPFAGSKEGLMAAHNVADVAIVSSANKEAVKEEWEKFGLMDWVDICLTQTEGSKAYCIGEMVKAGYAPDHVLMVGDAPGDLAAAEKNQVLYYPILVKGEEASWKRFVQEALPKFLESRYKGEYQEQMIRVFRENLS